MHFFNPVPVLNLVELVPSLLTGEPTHGQGRGVRRRACCGKQVIRSQDRAGFVVNALLIPYLLSAIRMLRVRASPRPRTSTTAWCSAARHPMGPLRLTDLIGLDTTKAIAESMYDEFKEPLYAPPLLARMVDAGCSARSRPGFYVSDPSSTAVEVDGFVST